MRSRFYAFTATERGRKEEPPSQKAAPPSAAQKHFLERELLHRHQVRVTRAMLLVLLLALWELASRFSWIDSFIFSSPSMIFDHFCAMAQDGSLFLHTGVTLMETLISFFFVTFLSLAAALLLWSNRTLAQILEPYLVMLNSLPKDVLSKVLLPSSIPLMVSSMKVNIGLCLVGVIIGEFLSSKAGLGYLITYGSQTFQMTLVVTSIVVLCVISALLYQLVAAAEKWIR